MSCFPLLYPLLLSLSTCPDKISQQSHSYTPGEDKQIEDAVSLCNVCEKGYCVLV